MKSAQLCSHLRVLEGVMCIKVTRCAGLRAICVHALSFCLSAGIATGLDASCQCLGFQALPFGCLSAEEHVAVGAAPL